MSKSMTSTTTSNKQKKHRHDTTHDKKYGIAARDIDPLVSDATSTDMEGFLYKKGKDGKWRLRYGEITGNFLTIYKNEEMSELLAMIDLYKIGEVQVYPYREIDGKVASSPLPALSQDSYVISVDVRGGRLYLLRAASFREAIQWKNAFCTIRDGNMKSADSDSKRLLKEEVVIQIAPSASMDIQEYFQRQNALLVDNLSTNSSPVKSGNSTPSFIGSPISIPKSPLVTKSSNSSPRRSPKYRTIQVSPSKTSSVENHEVDDIPPLEPIEEVEEDKLEEEVSHKSEVDDVPTVSSRKQKNRDTDKGVTKDTAKDNLSISTDDVLVYLSRWQTTVIFLLIAFLLGSSRIYYAQSSNLTFPKSWSNMFTPQASIEKVKIYMKHKTSNQSEMPPPSSTSTRKGSSSNPSGGNTGNNGGSLYPLVPAKSTPWKKFISFLKKLSSLPNNLLRGIF